MFFKRKILSAFFALLILLAFSSVSAQDVLDDLAEEDRIDSEVSNDQAPSLSAETISNISPSKKIFILSNENQSFAKGDFISLLLVNQLVCRALVAKTTPEKMSGIKIVKIYNLALWKQLKTGKEVLVLKGDDSYYSNKEKSPKNDQDKMDESRLQTDEDLYNSTMLSGDQDDLSLEENNKRLIKPDNLFSLNVGLIDGKDVDGGEAKYTQFNGAWAYQVNDNIWFEGGLGTNTITDYPYTGLDTRLTNVVLKAKYTVSAPFYSYIQPYVGYQFLSANSPGAGVDPGDGTRSTEQLAGELQLVQSLEKSSVIFGITLLKRLVPGWFMRADLGTDIFNGGLTIEF